MSPRPSSVASSDTGSDSSSDLYDEHDEVDSPVKAPHLVASAHPADASPSSDQMYDDSPAPTPAQVKGKRRLASEEKGSESVKRRKVVLTPERYFSTAIPALAGLPAEVWQHIALYFTPDDLSRCLRINRLFQYYLTSITASMSVRLPPRRTGLKLLDSESIWTSSRKIFAPNLPRPLAGFTEMRMFQLLGGKNCQGCGMLPRHPVKPTSQLDAGPGPDGVRIIWSLNARLCAHCFEAASVKDVDVLVSPVASLVAGLAYAFRTPDMHYIAATLQNQAAANTQVVMSKVYSLKHIDDLQQEHQNAMEFGEAASEEWIKGLPLLGKQQMADSARWERWEQLLPLGSDIAKVLREYFRPSSVLPVDEVPVAAPTASATSLPAHPATKMKHPLPARVVAAPAAPTSTNLPSINQSPPQSSKAQARPPRNIKEVNEAKAIRRAEIERRCYEEFQPPLMPRVLTHMESFHAAMQISTPLTDSAWEVLKPRLYAQRDAAEQIEYMRQEQIRALQATIPAPNYQATHEYTVDPSVALRQYEAEQGPIRKKLGNYADEFIRAKWNGGKRLSRENCPEFAVEVLLYARQKYLDVHKPKTIPYEQITETTDPWFVSLENMRWLFDNRVKTVTDKQCRELFHCSECKASGKAYAFEGMIQHFGAKHTTEFSRGNIVVHWQTAEWPDEPPFQPCNGHTADPTLPENATTKQNSKGSKPQNQPPHTIAIGASSIQSAHPSPAYGNGVYWPEWAGGNFQHPAPYDYQGYPPAASAAYAAGDQAPYSAYNYYGQSYPTESSDRQAYQPPPATIPKPSSHTRASPISSQVNQDHLNEVASIAKEIWDKLVMVVELEESIRIHTILHHVVSRFRYRFGNDPSLDLLTDALATHTLMRPIKNANGMACKTCISSRLDGYLAFQPYANRITDSKLYNTSSLITHFKMVHLQSVDDAKYLKWQQDMIELPEDATIREVMFLVGMNSEKLAIIAEAFPKVFSGPLPQIAEVKESATKPIVKPVAKSRQENLLNRKASQKKNKKAKRTSGHRLQPASQEDTQDEQSDALPEPAEDEYDPRRPAFIESSRQDRNQGGLTRRSLGDTQRQTAPSVDLTTLAPETLEALSKLYPENSEIQNALIGKTERSPSVPRADGPDRRPSSDAQRQNRNAFGGNRLATQQESYHREANNHGGARNGRANHLEPTEDYSQIIRTPASGPYEQHTITGPPAHERYVSVDPRGPAVPYPYEYNQRPYHADHYARPEYRTDFPPPAPYAYEPRPETVYVDQYGRQVEVVRVIERHPPPMYGQPPQHPEYLPREDPHRRYVYYEQPPQGPPVTASGYGAPMAEYDEATGAGPRYVYGGDSRGSVPRM